MFIMPSEYTALQSRVKALETLIETLEERIIALEESPAIVRGTSAIEATKSIKRQVIPGFPVGYNWDDFKPALKSNMLWPWLEDK